MNQILNSIKHTIFGIHNIPKILFNTGRLVDQDMKKRITSGNVKYPQTVDIDLCIGCSVCSRICPTKCITMKDLPEKVQLRENQYKTQYPEIDISRCCFCYQCHDSCPTFTVHKKHAAINPRNVTITGVKAQDLFKPKEESK